MASLEATIGLQMTRAAFIKNVHDDLLKPDAPKLGASALEMKLTMLKSYWDKLEASHEKLISVSSKLEGLLDLPYMTDKVFDTTLAYFSTAQIKLTDLFEKESSKDPNKSRRSTLPSAHSYGSIRRALPDIDIPKFSGVYSQWRSFRDLFQSMIISNTEITNVERMHYLKTGLSEEPAQIISNLTVSEASFDTAWELLTSRYENKRLLIAARLEQLLCPSQMSSHTSRELNKLVTSVSEALSALNALGEPTDQWGPVVVHTVVQRLSVKLREAWENRIGASTEYPSFAQLLEFLRGRARAMESLEITSSSSSHKPINSPSQTSNKNSSKGKTEASHSHSH